MSQINASVSGASPITASVGETQIDVAAGGTAAQVDVSVSGGFGPSGANGAAGAAATVSVGTVTTGAPGSSATVTNAGTSSAAVLNFTIPAGAAGAAGATGPAGSAGAAGAAGAAATVTVGTVTTGAAGSSATVTNVGSSSAAVLNFTIPAGASGAQGPAGTTTWAGITDKPSTFAPSAHSASHAAGGGDQLFNQALNTTDAVTFAGVTITGTFPALQIAQTVGLYYDSEAGYWLLDCGDEEHQGVISRFSLSNCEEIEFLDDTVQTTAWTGSFSYDDLDDLPTLFDGAYSSLTGLPTLGTAAAAASTDFAAASHNQAWSTITSTPTSLAGYGITDAASSSHTHAQLHDRSHAITSSSDHTATAWRLFYSQGEGVITELALGASGTVLTSGGASAAPTFSALPAGGTKTIIRFSPADNQPPSTNFATLDTRNSILVLEFDAATQESANFIGLIPEGASLTNGLTVRLWWMGDTATSGNVRWGVSFEAVGTDNDSDSFSSVTEATGAANGTSGIETVTSITATAIDSLAAGDRFRLRVARIAADATNDTMTGDAQLVAVEVRVA